MAESLQVSFLCITKHESPFMYPAFSTGGHAGVTLTVGVGLFLRVGIL